LQAWLDVLEPGADVGEVALSLSRARKAGAGSPKVHLYAGHVLKRLGRHASALREYRQVLELEPRNVEAAREVWMYEKSPPRAPSAPPAPSAESEPASQSGSPWSRLFKR